MTRANCLVFAGFGALIALLGGCNAVLGIEEAHSRDGLGTGSAKLVVPIQTCNVPKGNCVNCAAVNCPMSWSAALASHEGREALDDYRACLGARCNNQECVDELQAGPLTDLANCLPDSCGECLGTSPLIEMCDLYCACMQNDCDQHLVTEAMPPYALTNAASCKAHCLTLDLASVHCRFSHCQLESETPLHCQHAISDARCPPVIPVGTDCLDKRLDGWGCSDSSQCCNKSCSTNKICE